MSDKPRARGTRLSHTMHVCKDTGCVGTIACIYAAGRRRARLHGGALAIGCCRSRVGTAVATHQAAAGPHHHDA
eukprot:2955367-Pyramimonas_sp.AAC.1